MKTFIRVAEVWVPDADGHLLEFGGGLYGSATTFGAISRQMCFGRGEGLPGRVWEEGRPILLKDLQGAGFRRAAAAKDAELTGAVAFPVYVDDEFKAVVVLFCGGDAEEAGAIELWRNDPRITGDMTLVDGYYGAASAGFEATGRETYLPRGSGLPGLAWQREGSVFIEGLSDSAKFVRAAEAAAAGIERGLAIPCPLPTRDTWVLAFLSASPTPIARRVESWAPDAEGAALQRTFGFCETDGSLPAGEAQDADAFAQAIGKALSSGVPSLRPRASGHAVEAGPGGMIALPIAGERAVAEAVALYF